MYPATIKKLKRLATATHAASKKGKGGVRKVHAVWLSPNGRVAVPVCGATHFHWDALHDAHDPHTGSLSARPAVESAWGCARCQSGLRAGTIQFEKVEA